MFRRGMCFHCSVHTRNTENRPDGFSQSYRICLGEPTGLLVRASDSESGDPGSILGRVGVLFPGARDIYSPKVLVIPRNRWLRLNMTEKLFTGTLNKNENKKTNTEYAHPYSMGLADCQTD